MKFLKLAQTNQEVGGIAEKHGVKPPAIEDELKMGVEVESEHADTLDFFKKLLKKNDVEMPISDEEFFKMIALAHLREMKDYYTKLKAMEG